MKDRYREIEDYQCRMQEFAIQGSQREIRTINYYFKKPKRIRMDILKGNRAFDRGSVGVYTGGEKVTGHRGGIMKGITLSVPLESPLATSVRGETMDRSDMLTVIERVEYLTQISDIVIEEKSSRVEFEFTPHDPEQNRGVTRDIVWIDLNTMLIIRNERYEQEKLVQQVIWSDYIINAGLPLELFDAHFDIQDLLGSGIPLLSQELDE
jgi:outer membrane lipoprotein-sorting protein